MLQVVQGYLRPKFPWEKQPSNVDGDDPHSSTITAKDTLIFMRQEHLVPLLGLSFSLWVHPVDRTAEREVYVLLVMDTSYTSVIAITARAVIPQTHRSDWLLLQDRRNSQQPAVMYAAFVQHINRFRDRNTMKCKQPIYSALRLIVACIITSASEPS